MRFFLKKNFTFPRQWKKKSARGEYRETFREVL
jgi:hypothetical protein